MSLGRSAGRHPSARLLCRPNGRCQTSPPRSGLCWSGSSAPGCGGRSAASASCDCPEFEIRTPAGNTLIVPVNHLKSKGYGGAAASNARRKAQAARVKAIYQELRASGRDYVAVLGDLNDSPGSDPLKPLIAETDLKDISSHADFDDGGFPGTYGGAGASQKINYVLLSPKLMERAHGGGIFRKGMWPGTRPVKWEKYPEIDTPAEAASDHGAIWAEIDI